MPQILYVSEKVKNHCLLDEKAAEAIRRLANDELTGGNNIESLKSDALLLSMRVDEKRRIVFTYDQNTKDEHGGRIPIVLLFDENHKYDLNKMYSALLAAQSEKFKESIANQLETKKHDPDEAIEHKNVRIIGDRAVQLDDYQLSISLPASLEGVAGSGKTTVAYNFLEEYLENIQANQRVLYVAQSLPLIQKIQSCLAQNPLFDNDEINNRVDILTYEELAKSQMPGLNFEDNSSEKICNWLKTTPGVIGKNYKGENRESRATKIYNEFRIICGLNKPEDYLEVSEKITIIPKESRPEILKVYIQWLDEDKRHFIDFTPFENNNEGIYDLVLVDESQDLSFRELMNLKKLCKKDGNSSRKILFCHDPKQRLQGNAELEGFLKTLFKNEGEISCQRLEKNYRCPPKVMSLAKIFNDLRKGLVKSRASEAKISEDKESTTNKEGMGLTVWLDAKNDRSRSALENIKLDPDACIIADDEDKNELIKKGFSRVFTVQEIKGLEFRRVYLYQPFKPQVHAALNRAIANSNEGAAADKEGNLHFGPLLCGYFTAVTRSQYELGIYQSQHENLKELLSCVKPFCDDKSEVTKAIALDKEKSERSAKNAFLNGNAEQAFYILEREVFSDDKDPKSKATAMIDSWKLHNPTKSDEKAYKENLAQSLSENNWKEFNQLLQCELLDKNRARKERTTELKKYLYQVILKFESDDSQGLIEAIVLIIGKLGKDIIPSTEIDIDILCAARKYWCSSALFESEKYIIDKAFNYFRSKNAGPIFLRTFTEQATRESSMIPENDVLRILEMVSSENNPEEVSVLLNFLNWFDIHNKKDNRNLEYFMETIQLLSAHDYRASLKQTSVTLDEFYFTPPGPNNGLTKYKDQLLLTDTLYQKSLGKKEKKVIYYVNKHPLPLDNDIDFFSNPKQVIGLIDSPDFLELITDHRFLLTQYLTYLYLLNEVNHFQALVKHIITLTDPRKQCVVSAAQLSLCIFLHGTKHSLELEAFIDNLLWVPNGKVTMSERCAVEISSLIVDKKTFYLVLSSDMLDFSTFHHALHGTYYYSLFMSKCLIFFAQRSQMEDGTTFGKSFQRFLTYIESGEASLHSIRFPRLFQNIKELNPEVISALKDFLAEKSDKVPENHEFIGDLLTTICMPSFKSEPIEKYDLAEAGYQQKGDIESVKRLKGKKEKYISKIGGEQPRNASSSSMSPAPENDIVTLWDDAYKNVLTTGQTSAKYEALLEIICRMPQELACKIKILLENNSQHIDWNYQGKGQDTNHRTLPIVLAMARPEDYKHSLLCLFVHKNVNLGYIDKNGWSFITHILVKAQSPDDFDDAYRVSHAHFISAISANPKLLLAKIAKFPFLKNNLSMFHQLYLTQLENKEQLEKIMPRSLLDNLPNLINHLSDTKNLKTILDNDIQRAYVYYQLSRNTLYREVDKLIKWMRSQTGYEQALKELFLCVGSCEIDRPGIAEHVLPSLIEMLGPLIKPKHAYEIYSYSQHLKTERLHKYIYENKHLNMGDFFQIPRSNGEGNVARMLLLLEHFRYFLFSRHTSRDKTFAFIDSLREAMKTFPAALISIILSAVTELVFFSHQQVIKGHYNPLLVQETHELLINQEADSFSIINVILNAQQHLNIHFIAHESKRTLLMQLCRVAKKCPEGPKATEAGIALATMLDVFEADLYTKCAKGYDAFAYACIAGAPHSFISAFFASPRFNFETSLSRLDNKIKETVIIYFFKNAANSTLLNNSYRAYLASLDFMHEIYTINNINLEPVKTNQPTAALRK